MKPGHEIKQKTHHTLRRPDAFDTKDETVAAHDPPRSNDWRKNESKITPVQDGAKKMAESGWGTRVKSEKLDDWIDALKETSDPWIEVTEGTVLRSALFDGLTSAELVRDRAVILIEQLNGAMAASLGAKPIQFDGVVIQFMPDGRKHRTLFVETGFFALSGMRADAQVVGPDGKPKASPSPKPSEAQNWMNIGKNDEQLANALIYFGRASNWFDIYKTLECPLIPNPATNRRSSVGCICTTKG